MDTSIDGAVGVVGIFRRLGMGVDGVTAVLALVVIAGTEGFEGAIDDSARAASANELLLSGQLRT